jgi:dienelactone hydrolase
MARVNHRCPECGAEVPLAGVATATSDIKCPECGAWFAPPPRYSETEGGVYSSDEGHSNAGLWIGLAIGGGFLLLMAVCGGIGGILWMVGAQRQQRQAVMQAPAFGKSATVVTPLFANPTEFPAQTEDYAEARKKFKTNLVIPGPAPQTAQQMQLPPDVTQIEYVSGDLRLSAWVTSDPGAGPEKKPAVLFLHNGFAFGMDDWQMIQPFREAGYVVMIPMLRGENWQPGNYSLFYDEVNDVLAAADALAKLPYVDGKRLYLAGHSNGGTLTLLTAMTTSRFRAAASFSGSPDQTNWNVVRSNMPSYGGEQMAQLPFDEDNRKEFEMRSPLAFPESFKCPVRLYFGSQEPYFKATNQKLAELAKKKKRDVEAIEVPGDHLSSVDPAMRQGIEFFKKQEPRTK